MPKDEWNFFPRNAKIFLHNIEIGHPIESHIWEMDVEEQVKYLLSIAKAGCNQGRIMPTEFIDWIEWKLGKRIAENYMIPYNTKMFNKELEELGTYWLQKLPNVSFEETLRSCLLKREYGLLPGHACFYYPKKYGYGELWKRMAQSVKDNIEYNANIVGIDFNNKIVFLEDGRLYKADIIITTIPWRELEILKGMPSELKEDIKKLKFSSIETRYYENKISSNAHWIYCPDPSLPHHRILIRSNFCTNSRGYWTETNSQRIGMIPEEDRGRFNYMNFYAYPLNTIDKPQIMSRLFGWMKGRQIYGLGRWGEWEHYNSDVTVELAMKLADTLEE